MASKSCAKQSQLLVNRAFTLIELLICASILPVITVALAALIGSLNSARVETQARLDARESAWRALSRWREDVACASRIELGPDPQMMTVVRRTRDGSEAVIRYQPSAAGRLVRIVETKASGAAPKTEILCENCSDLEFRRVGRAWRVGWNIVYADGVSKRIWPQSGFAASAL